MTDPYEKIIDNRAGLLDESLEGLVEDVFSYHLGSVLPDNAEPQQMRLDIGAGYVFLSGLRRILPLLSNLREHQLLSEITEEKWGTEAPIRVVMGSQTTRQTKDVLLQLLKLQFASFEDDELRVLGDLMADNLIEFRVQYNRRFHAKIFNFYHGSEVPSATWVGSANLTSAGLSDNIELSVPVDYVKPKTRKNFRAWFDSLWRMSSPDLDALEIINEIRESEYIHLSPRIFFMSLAKLLGKEYLFDVMTETSEANLLLDFQTLSYSIVMDRLRRFGGVILANSVGLGKSYVACQVMRSLIRSNPEHDCLLIYPPRIETEWRNLLSEFGIDSKVVAISRGILQKPPEDTEDRDDFFDSAIHEGKYSVIVVDECHNFRNPSNRRTNLDNIIKRNPQAVVLMVSATPINLGIKDLFSLIDLFYRGDITGRFSNQGLKRLYDTTKSKVLSTADADLSLDTVQNIRNLENELVLKISWRIVQEHFKDDIYRLARSDVMYEEPDISELKYDYPKSIRRGLFDRIVPFLQGLNYEPAKLWDGEGYKDDKNLTFWYKWQLYKRLESSLFAFYKSVQNMYVRFSLFLKTFEENKIAQDIEENKYLEDDGFDLDSLIDEDRLSVALNTYKEQSASVCEQIVERLMEDVASIKDMLETLNEEVGALSDIPYPDDKKLEALRETLKEKRVPMIVFSQYADTIDYLDNALKQENLRFEAIHGGMSKGKDMLLRRYEAGDIDIILTTDVLSEGVSIPRADAIINYDLPYNPVVLVQRAGRALRITNPKKLLVYNFVPDKRIDKELALYEKLDVRLRTILDIVGLDFVIWLMEEKKVKGVHERERRKFLENYEEYKKALANQNPDDMILRVSLPSETEVDRILKRVIREFGLVLEDLADIPTLKRTFYTCLRGERGLATVTREGLDNLSVRGLKEYFMPCTSDALPSWFQEEKESQLKAQRERLIRDRLSRKHIPRKHVRLNRDLRSVFDILQDETERKMIHRVRRLVESQALTEDEFDTIRRAVDEFLSSSSSLVPDETIVQKSEAWTRMSAIVANSKWLGNESFNLEAFIVYKGE